MTMTRHSAFLAVFAASMLHATDCMECMSLSLSQLSAGASSVRPAYSWSRGEAETNKIDILIVFDASAQAWIEANGCGSMEDFARKEVDCLNEGIANTGLERFFTFRLVGVKAVGVDFSANKINTTLYNFIGSVKAKTDEANDATAEVRALRDSVAADVVGVMVDCDLKSPYGVSYKFLKEDLTANGLEDLARHAYCVCDVTTLRDKFTLMHELGHMFGAGHDDEQHSDPGPQLMEYSSGYRFEANGAMHTTVMGITSSSGKTFIRWPFFSSPLYKFGENGPVVGTKKHNDNTRTISETYHIIANYRVAPPLDDSGLADEPESTTIDLAVERITDSGQTETISSGSEVALVRYVNVSFGISAVAPVSTKPTVKVKGLPRGMTYSSKTGLISGYPQKTGIFPVTVTAACKGFENVSHQFIFSVSDIPASLLGSYTGMVELDSGPTILTLAIASNGKATLKGRIEGKNRIFKAAGMMSAIGMENGEMEFIVQPAATINGNKTWYDIAISERAARLRGVDGVLRQIPWGRKDVVAPKIAKTVNVAAGDCQCKIRSGGRVLVSRKHNGVRVSGLFQLVPEDPTVAGGDGIFNLPIVFPAKKSYEGMATTFRFGLTVDQKNTVSQIEWIGE